MSHFYGSPLVHFMMRWPVLIPAAVITTGVVVATPESPPKPPVGSPPVQKVIPVPTPPTAASAPLVGQSRPKPLPAPVGKVPGG